MARGRQLWRAARVYDFSEAPEKQAILEEACCTADVVKRLQAVVDGADEIRLRGSQGQPVAMPELLELRQYRALMVHLLKALGTERGCTRPGCTAPAYWCQAHHVEGWATDDGPTNITTRTLACGPDNRLIEEAGWRTRKRTDGTTEWIPPPHLDTGQTRVNDYHNPERYLLREDDDDP